MQPNLLEAERRIEEARRTRAEILDLGDLALWMLPANLRGLPDLRKLYLGGHKPTETEDGNEFDKTRDSPVLTDLSPLAGLAGLQRLDLQFCRGVTDLSPLAGLAELQRLDLHGCTGVRDLSPLARLLRLQRLNLYNCRYVTDLSPLAGLAELQRLILDATGVADLAPLAGLKELQRLDFSHCKSVTDLSPLAGLAGLQSLSLMSTGVIDLSPLAGLPGLQSLDLPATGVRNLSPLSILTELQSLNLSSCTSVTDLSPLSGLTGLQMLSLQYCTGVTNLSPLSALARLRRLYLLKCTGVRDLSPLAGAVGLQILNLQDCQDVKNLSPLAGLVGLQRLHLDGTGAANLAPLAGLVALQSLDLRSCKNVTDLSPMFGLKSLQSLRLDGTGVADLSPLAGLVGLQKLDLESCKRVADLSPLSGLTSLQSLDLESTGVSDLSPLTGLAGLQDLDLRNTRVTDLSPLADLAGLQDLDLTFTRVSDLAPLAGLAGLQRLKLDRTDIRDLSPLSNLVALQSLDLQDCPGVRDLSPLAGLVGLRNLDLQGCTGVTDLSPLSGLARLQSLNLNDCRAAISKELLRVLTGRLIWLAADKAAGVPQEVLSRIGHENCLPRLRIYLAELDVASEAETEVKVILLGNGRVGKTQLCRRLRGEPFDESVPSTHGVQIWRKELRLRAGDQEQVFQVNWWDFGGQDIYHGTHALFLRSRAVFLILWSPHLENRAEYEENGIPLRNQSLAYWLDYVRSLAGEGSPVIVVQSQCDRFADRRPDPPRPNGFGFFQGCAYSAKTDLGREPLEAQLREAIRYLLDRTGELQIGLGRAKVRHRLYEWRAKDQKLKPEKRQHRTLTLEEFREVCDRAGGIVSWEHTLDYLHQTGVVFYDANLFSDRIVLDQDWALDAIYSVFHRGKILPWLRSSGRFTREDLAAVVWQNHSVEEQKLFLGLMKSCGVCFACRQTPKDGERYVAPDLLPAFEDSGGHDRVLDSWREEADTPTLRLEHRFFHRAVIRGLMSEIGQQAGDLAEYWKYGLWLKDGRRESQLLVQFVDTATHDAPGAGALELKAQGHDPQGLLREIREMVLWKQIGEAPAEFLILDGVTVARSALVGAIDGRVLDVHGKPVQAAAFAAFFEGREPRPDAKINFNPQPTTPDDKRRPEVFISYAWGDDTPAGKIRGEVVDRLCESLEKDGFRPVRDRNEMRHGDLISGFGRRLTRADLVVAVISDKYLRSPFCMDEIHGLWQKSLEDRDLMAECLVPIVLPEAKIERIQDRAPYLKYWKAEWKELRKLQREHGADWSPAAQREFHLVRNIAQNIDAILDFLQDVLMSRTLDAHLDDGFEAVREALRRRIR